MSSVTNRIREIKQPRGGYVHLSDFENYVFNDGYLPYTEENIHASIVGMAVDNLTRLMLGENKEEIFSIAINGAIRAEKTIKNAPYIAYQLYSDINNLDYNSIKSACKLASFEVWRRNPAAARSSKTYNDINPDENTIDNISHFVSRGISFFDKFGPITSSGFTFEPPGGDQKDYLKMVKSGTGSWGGYTPTIDSGDGDFLTKDTIWDYKVLSSDPKPQHTLQLLVYWIMGRHSGQQLFKSITKVGIFNPRRFTINLLDVTKIPFSTIKTIEDEVICY